MKKFIFTFLILIQSLFATDAKLEIVGHFMEFKYMGYSNEYVIEYIPLSNITSFFVEHYSKNSKKTYTIMAYGRSSGEYISRYTVSEDDFVSLLKVSSIPLNKLKRD